MSGPSLAQTPRMRQPPDLEAEYNNRARVPEHPAVIQGWMADAAAWRDRRPPQRLAYGPGEREVIDLFAGEGEAGGPAALFLHGGYWQAMDRAAFSHMARGLNLNGVTVGVAGYDLCPEVRIDDIVAQARAATRALQARTGGAVTVFGHSAGGHLAACVLATEAAAPAALAISGLFELAPLIPTSLNAALGLDAEAAARLSPIQWPAPAGKALDLLVGEVESGEFHRQSRIMAERWGAAGVATRCGVVARANHFTVLAPFADPDSAETRRLAEMVRG